MSRGLLILRCSMQTASRQGQAGCHLNERVTAVTVSASLISTYFTLAWAIGKEKKKKEKKAFQPVCKKTYVNSPILNDLAGYQPIAALGDSQE